MPVHPTLAAILGEWKLSGWPAAFSRTPKPDDRVLPVTPEPARKGRRKALGAMRDKNYTWKRLRWDLATLGLRPRRVHDGRRTLISLAVEDGADETILKRGTHAPPKDIMGLYTSVAWETLCREVAKLRVERRTTGKVIAPATKCTKAPNRRWRCGPRTARVWPGAAFLVPGGSTAGHREDGR